MLQFSAKSSYFGDMAKVLKKSAKKVKILNVLIYSVLVYFGEK